MALLKQSTAYSRAFYLVSSTDHITGKTGASPAVTISKAAATFAAAAGTVTEISAGWYKIALTTVDTNTLGDLAYDITASGADATDFADQVVAFDTTDAVHLGLSAIPNATAGAASGLIINGTNSGGVTIQNSGGNALTLQSTGGNGHGLAMAGNGTGDGFHPTGGATGNGMQSQGGVTSGKGLLVSATTGDDAVRFVGAGAGDAFKIIAGATGNAMELIGGGTSGDGFVATVTSGVTFNVGLRVQKNLALSSFVFYLTSSVDHVSPAVGVTVTATRSLDGAAFAACANSVTEIANGYYKINLAAADLNAKVVALSFTGVGADGRALTILTQT